MPCGLCVCGRGHSQDVTHLQNHAHPDPFMLSVRAGAALCVLSPAETTDCLQSLLLCATECQSVHRCFCKPPENKPNLATHRVCVFDTSAQTQTQNCCLPPGHWVTASGSPVSCREAAMTVETVCCDTRRSVRRDACHENTELMVVC